MSRSAQLPQPTKLERWVGEGGWFVDLLLPSTDAGVAVQAVIVALTPSLRLPSPSGIISR